MAVQVATLDILVERGGFDPKIARAIGDAITMEVNAARDALATKQDLFRLHHDTQDAISDVFRAIQAVRFELKFDIACLRCELREGLAALRAEVKEELAKLRSEFRQELAELRSEFRQELAELRSEFKQELAALRSEFKEDLARLRGEFKEDLAKLRSDLTRQIYVAILGQMAVYLGIAYFFVTQVLPRG